MLVQFSITAKSGKVLVYKYNPKTNSHSRYYKGNSQQVVSVTAEEYGKALHHHRNEWENRPHNRK